jgi:hypothetical protein
LGPANTYFTPALPHKKRGGKAQSAGPELGLWPSFATRHPRLSCATRRDGKQVLTGPTKLAKSKASFVKLSWSICDLFVNLNKNDSYYIQLHKEKKVLLVFFLKVNIITNHSH